MTTKDGAGGIFHWSHVSGDLLRVRCQKRRPRNASVAVPYRGYWYYIEDGHLSSKSTFTLLLQLFELQRGGGAKGTKPVMTLSVGG